MEDGLKKCPKCDGSGKKEYIYFQIGTVIENLSLLKKGKAIQSLSYSARQIRIICPFCDGTGTVDWINWARRQNFNKPFSNLEGCLDIFLDRYPFYQCYNMPLERNGVEIIDDLSEYSNPEKIIKLSRERYDEPLKLNNDFLAMDSAELERIGGIINWHHLEVTKPYTEEKILNYLGKSDLYQYKPDKFAYPQSCDIDEKFF